MKGFLKLAALCAAFLSACGDGGVQSPDFTPELLGLSVTPVSANLRIGETESFSASGTFSAQPGSSSPTTTEPVSPSWSVDDESVATIAGDGTLTAVGAGTAVVTASLDGVSASANIVVAEPELLTIEVSPASASIDNSQTQTFTATGTFSNGGDSEPFTGPVTVSWSSSDTAVATINSSGVATGLTAGTVEITASSGGIEGTATLTVSEVPVLVGITVEPQTFSAPLGDTVEFTATGQYETPSGGSSTGPVTVEWSVVNDAVAVIDASRGIAQGVAQGSTQVRATNGAIVGTATLTITAPELREVVVTPETASVPEGASQVFEARGVYSDSAAPRLIDDATVNWTISPGTAASLTPPASGASVEAVTSDIGEETVTATAGALSDSAQLSITAAELTSLLRVSPTTGRVVPGTSQEFRAIGGFTDGSEAPIDDANVNWTSSETSLATIDSDTGIATGVAEGEVTITATLADGYEPAATPRSATADLIIADEACPVPLLESDNASVGTDVGVGCLGCAIENPENVIDEDEENFATFTVPVGLLGAEAALTVAAGETDAYTLPFPAGSQTGFVISHEEGALLSLELLSQVSITTLLNSTEQETSDELTPLRLDLLGTSLIGEDIGLLSFETTKPFNAVRLTFNSGVATALSSMNVLSACGTVVLPPPPATLVEVLRVAPAAPTVLIDGSTELSLIGLYDDGTEGPIPDGDIDWSSSAPDVATIGSTGVATGVSLGVTTISATLKDGVAPGVTVRGAETTLEVITMEAACTTPLLAEAGALVTSDFGGLCVLCGVTDPENIIDDSIETAGTMFLPVALLEGQVSVTVSVAEDNDYELPFPGVEPAGFIISRPNGALLALEIGSSLTVETIRNGIVQESSEDGTSLRVDLLGLQLIGDVETSFALATLPTTKPFDSLRLTFSAGLATALSNVQVNSACATTVLPSAAP